MRRQPVRSSAGFHLDGDCIRKRKGRLHRVEDLRDEFFLFVQRLSRGLQPITMMRLVADRGRVVIEQVYPLTYDSKKPEAA